MKKIIMFIVFIGSIFNLKAQSFVGFLTDNYAGVNSVIVNPANAVDSRYKIDINLVGVSVFGGNDFYNLELLEVKNDADYIFDDDARFSPKTNNNGALNLDVLGPSVLFNINNTNSIAIFTRTRAFVNAHGINGSELYAIHKNDYNDYIFNETQFNAFVQAWAEIGISYAKVLVNKKDAFLKGGITLKHLKGGGSAYAAGSNIMIDYDADGTLLLNGETTGSVTTTGEGVYGRYDDFEADNFEYELPKNTNGFGVDIGIIYEWRPQHGAYKPKKEASNRLTYKEQNKYKLKMGLSITDIGYINYKNGIEDVFDLTNTNVSEEDITNETTLNDLLNNFYTLTNTSIGYKTLLPTAVHLNADWRFTNNVFLNFNTDLSLTSKSKLRASKVTNMASLTPRFESKWFSFYAPLSVVQYTGFQSGAGFRLGPLYVGSSALFTNLFSKKSKGTDFFVGLKIPFFHGKIDTGSNCECYQ